MTTVSSKKSHVSSAHKTEHVSVAHTSATHTGVAHPHHAHPSAASVEEATTAAASPVLTQLRAVQASMHLRPRLTKEDRKQILTVANTTPTLLINAVAAASVAHGGSIAGTEFDATAAKATLDRAEEATAIEQWALDFAQTVSDDDLQARATLSESALHIYGMLPNYVRTANGAPLLGAYEGMREIVRTARKQKGRKPKPGVSTAPVTTTPTPVTASTPVVAVAPAAPKGGAPTS